MLPLVRRAVTALAVTATATMVAACGSSSSSTGVASAPATSPGSTAGAPSGGAAPASAKASGAAVKNGVAYAACMRKHGVNMPDPNGKGLHLVQGQGSPLNNAKITAAMQACKSLVPAGSQLIKPPASAVAALRAMAVCMRANGVPQFPDPAADGQLTLSKSSGIDPTTPQFKAAQAKCAKYAPAGSHLSTGGGAVSGGGPVLGSGK